MITVKYEMIENDIQSLPNGEFFIYKGDLHITLFDDCDENATYCRNMVSGGYVELEFGTKITTCNNINMVVN